MHTLEYVSGKKKVQIPWTKVTTKPADWIDEECYPPGFEWVDPSKIWINDAYHLLDHWRQQKESGLVPIIWNPSCDILADVKKPYWHPQSTGGSHGDSTEDFSNELRAIHEHDEESQHSPPLPLSPTSAERRSHAVEISEPRFISHTAQSPISDHTCELALLCMH
jgi:hypothetical protein